MDNEQVVNERPKYEGQLVRLGGEDYIIPSLSVKQARALWPNILELNKGITEENLPEKLAITVKVVHAALTRNYPGITIEQVEDIVDLNNVRRLALIVSGESRLTGPGLAPVAVSEKATE